MTTLYELTEEMRAIAEVIDLAGGEVTDAVEAALDAQTINAENAADKLEGYGKIIANFTADVEGFKAEEKRLAERRRVVENVIARLKTRALEYMQAADEKKIKAGTFTFTVQKSAPSLVMDDDAAPLEFEVEQPPKYDRKAILAALKAGEKIPGCSIKQGLHLRIR